MSSVVYMARCAQAHHHLHALHELCWALGGLRLHRLDAAQAPRLSAFAADQAAALRAAGAALAGFSAAVADVMVAGCTEALQALQARLDQFAQRQVRQAHISVLSTARWRRCGCCLACNPIISSMPIQVNEIYIAGHELARENLQEAAQQARMQPLARTVLGGAAKAATEEFLFTRTAAKRTELRRLRQLVRTATLRIVSGLRQVL